MIKFTIPLMLLLPAALAFGQAQPPTLNLVAKLRDFKEANNTDNTNTHPDFNTFNGCASTGNVSADIATTGSVDSAVFPHDNRNPTLVRTTRQSDGKQCFTGAARFDEWFNDRAVNRRYLMDLTFNRLPNGMYEFSDNTFFPLDNKNPGEYRKIDPGDPDPFGHLNNSSNGTINANIHNYGFTMEFHAGFTYLAGTNQVFNFTGDDDVWVFINGKLVIDLGGVHGEMSSSVTLTNAKAAELGLVNGESYMLDFYFAERHIYASNCKITTTLVLGTQKVATPIATPGATSFASQIAVSLSTPTPGAAIHYTTNGAAPDSNSTLYVDGSPILIQGSTTIKAIAYKAGWEKSDVLTAPYAKTFSASTLEILDVNGNPFPGYLSELNTSYMVRVSTTQAGLASISPTASTPVALDNEALTLSDPVMGDRLLYSGVVAFSMGTAAANGATEAAHYDSLTVRWVNPRDPNDVAVKTLPVRPAPRQARAYFSTRPDGLDTTDTYTGKEGTLYLIVVDQILPPGVQPKATLATKPLVNPTSGESESFNLNAIPGRPGFYVAAIPVDTTGPATVPGRLRLGPSYQVTGTYLDPVDPESPAVANAGFGTAPVIDAALQFTDKDGNILPAGIHYSPGEAFLHLQYADDWADGTIPAKVAALTIVNNRGTAAADTETVSLALAAGKRQGSRGIWEGSIPLKDLIAVAPRNNVAETYILGEVTAVVISHNQAGGPDVPVSDQLQVAWPDKNPDIRIDPNPLSRSDSLIRITIVDQSLTSGRDTLYVNVSCSQTGDVVGRVMLIEKADSPGVYISVPVAKGEGAGSGADKVLTCRDKDIVKVSYVDPVYNTPKDITATIDNPVTTQLWYSSAPDGSVRIASVLEGESTSFYAVVKAKSPTVDRADAIKVKLTTPQGEEETFTAVETGPYTETFVVQVPFSFITGAPARNDGTVQGRIDATVTNNRVTATGSVTVDGVETRQDIVLIAAYVPVVNAWIKDVNGDGAGDKVYIRFEEKVGRLPATVDAQWNTALEPFKNAASGKISYLPEDSTVIVIDYTGSQFPAGMTSASASSPAVAKLPSDPLFAGQTPAIEDSIGPVIIQAVKSPANVNSLKPNDPGFNLDTLRITVSETIKSGTDLKDMLKFSTGCGDYANAKPVIAALNPTLDPDRPNTWIIIVDNGGSAVPLTGNCVFLNSDPGKVTDLQGNLPPRKGFELDGEDRKRVIQLFRGFPPVAGLDPENPTYQVAVQDSRNPDKGGYANAAGAILWIPPVGFDADAVRGGSEYKGYVPRNPKEQASGAVDATRAQGLPAWISAVQVISTSKYVAQVSIFDNLGQPVRSFSQAFGYRGELSNVERVVPKGLVSYLVWDLRDARGQTAGQGAYVWKVVFTFETGKQEIQYTRTGLMRGL